jgi:DNA mismatch repair protein MutS2
MEIGHSARVLEYDTIRRRVCEATTCTLGRERAEVMSPGSKPAEVRSALQETTEAVRLLDLPGGVPLGGIHDLRTAVKIAGAAGMLEPWVLLQVADTLASSQRLRGFLLQRRESVPALAERGERLEELPHVEQAIHEAISDKAEVRDDASPALERVRREMRTIRARMQDRLQQMTRSPAYKDMLQDPVITTRDGRYCLPVKSEYRVQFGGLVHDQSTSGATLFMEPAPIVEMGNELRQAEAKERQEVERILREVTAKVGAAASRIEGTLEVLGELDFICARGRLSLSMDGIPPEINEDGFIGLRRARHPLLTGDVVPIDLDLGRENTIIVITGPNTGGKTVSLKTVGLLALMTQSGLHVPADEGTTLPVFRAVSADIGDEQSIQQSLSTFSGHIANIAKILKQVEGLGREALVLLDEVGAGTDPTEGAALARSILRRLLDLGARAIATTHYGELKEFAYGTDGVENASVEFDFKTLRPTYRLLVGIPGASNAFAIAERLGLPGEVVGAARESVGAVRTQLSDVIERLTRDQHSSERDARRAANAAKELEQKKALLEQRIRQLEVDRTKTLERARQQADELVRSARKEAERFRNELRRLEKEALKLHAETGSEGAAHLLRGKLTSATERVERRAENIDEQVQKVERKAARRRGPEEAVPLGPLTDSRPPAIGDFVWIPELEQRGTLISEPADGRAQVQIGSLRTTLPYATLRRLLTPPEPSRIATPASSPGGGANMRMQARSRIAPEVKLIGMRAEDALMRLDEYVDQACLAGLSPFRIVHGKGTGALKRVVWEYLQAHESVNGFRHPNEEEGGGGVTVVELKGE